MGIKEFLFGVSPEEEQIDYYRARNHQLHTDIDSIKRVNNYERAGWFVLGVLATSLAIKGAQELR